jgi:hypothetical protein
MSLKNRCSEVGDYHVKKAWVFGHLKTTDTEYFILFGYQREPSEENLKAVLVVPEDDDGRARADLQSRLVAILLSRESKSRAMCDPD